jgi:hypothetical protein
MITEAAARASANFSTIGRLERSGIAIHERFSHFAGVVWPTRIARRAARRWGAAANPENLVAQRANHRAVTEQRSAKAAVLPRPRSKDLPVHSKQLQQGGVGAGNMRSQFRRNSIALGELGLDAADCMFLRAPSYSFLLGRLDQHGHPVAAGPLLALRRLDLGVDHRYIVVRAGKEHLAPPGCEDLQLLGRLPERFLRRRQRVAGTVTPRHSRPLESRATAPAGRRRPR